MSRRRSASILARIGSVASAVAVAGAALLNPSAPAPTTTPAPSSVQPNGPKPAAPERTSPAAIAKAQQIAATAVGGGFVAYGVRREPIWTGRLRDSGMRSRPCSRRAGRGRR